MEYSERPVWNDYTQEELGRLKVWPSDEEAGRRVLRSWDAVAKPIGSLGRLEALTAQIGAIIGSDRIDISRKAVIVMCADNGVVEEGISQSGQEVTCAVARAMAEKKSSVCRMAQAAGADVIPVDIGINRREPIPGVLDRKIRCGTKNFSREPAMTEEETIRALAVGIDMVYACKEAGYGILAAGEMGIGNTTTSSAVTAALTGCRARETVGRGAGLDDAGLERKRRVIDGAIEKYGLRQASPLRVLSAVGGLDIAAALAADRILPGTKAYLLPSHKGREPAAKRLAEELRLEPVIDADLALGEGTGAVMMFSLLDAAMSVYGGRTTFADLQMEPYRRI